MSLPSSQFGATAPSNERNRDVMPDGRWVSPIPAIRASHDMEFVPEQLQIRVVLNWLGQVRKRIKVHRSFGFAGPGCLQLHVGRHCAEFGSSTQLAGRDLAAIGGNQRRRDCWPATNTSADPAVEANNTITQK